MRDGNGGREKKKEGRQTEAWCSALRLWQEQTKEASVCERDCVNSNTQMCLKIPLAVCGSMCVCVFVCFPLCAVGFCPAVPSSMLTAVDGVHLHSALQLQPLWLHCCDSARLASCTHPRCASNVWLQLRWRARGRRSKLLRPRSLKGNFSTSFVSLHCGS